MADDALVQQVAQTRDLAGPLAWTVGISSVGALAAQLRSNRKLDVRHVAAAILTSAVAGVIVALALADKLGDSPARLISISSLAGLGGANTIELMLAALRARAGETK